MNRPAFMWNPAGADLDLAQAALDLRAGRFHEARDLIAATRTDFEARAHRSLVLASVAAGLDVAERWIAEEPSNPDALLIYARTAVARALRAADAGDERAEDLVALARRACLVCADADPKDPTPWAGLLALARLGHSKIPGPEGVTARGPWDLLGEVRARHPLNREAHHRMLTCFYVRYGGSHDTMWEVARWIALGSPSDCSLQLLPLNAYVEQYRDLRDDPVRGPAIGRQWTEQHAQFTAMHVYEGWFRRVQDEAMVPVADFSVLAHALYMGGRLWEAATVLRAMGPYATTHPWSLFGEPVKELTRARQRCRVRAP